MKKNHTKTIGSAVLLYFAALTLLSVIFKMNHLILRQNFRRISEFLVFAGLLYLMILAGNRIAAEKKIFRLVASLVITVLACFFLLCVFFHETDRETVAVIDGQKKIRVESSWIMFYEVSYHDYENALWYRKYPYIEENYDDGDPGQWIYTDYYDENGVFVNRVYKDE